MSLPDKLPGGGLTQIALPVWKPERVFNLAAVEVNFNDPDGVDNPKDGRYFTVPVTVQLWVADTHEDDYYAVASVTVPPGKWRGFSLCGFTNAFGFEEVVRIPSTAQCVVVTDAIWAPVYVPPGMWVDPDDKPQIDLKPLGTFL